MLRCRRVAAPLCALIASLALAGSPARAADLVFDFNEVFSSSGLPTGAAPWLRAEFTNVNATQVDLSITALFQGNTKEFIAGGSAKGVFFNFDPTKTLPSASSFAYLAGQNFNSVTVNEDAINAGGGGDYDIRINYANSGANRLTDGEFTKLRITGAQAADFLFLAEDRGGNGPYYAVAHIQGTGSDGSGSAWVAPNAIPEPAFYQLGTLLGLGGIAMLRRRKKS